MKKLLSILLAVLLMLTFSSLIACDSCDEADPICGTYSLTSYTIDGQEMPGMSSSIVLNDDNTFTMTQTMNGPEETYTGTWAKDDTTVTLTDSEDPDDPLAFTIGENTLTLTMTFGGATQTMTFTKQ